MSFGGQHEQWEQRQVSGVKGEDRPGSCKAGGAVEQNIFIGRYFSGSDCFQSEHESHHDTLTHLLLEICVHISIYCVSNNVVTVASLYPHEHILYVLKSYHT